VVRAEGKEGEDLNTKWTCPACKKIEVTGPNVKELAHDHAGTVYQLSSFRKQRQAPGKITVKSLKKDAWDVFSEYIRRHYADDDGYVQCVTCQKTAHWKEMQGGHFLSRTHNIILFDERNVHPQCPYCNGPKSGNITAYQAFMLEKYGQETVDELFRLAKIQHKFSVKELGNLMAKYKEML
jgi:hypothetical protein